MSKDTPDNGARLIAIEGNGPNVTGEAKRALRAYKQRGLKTGISQFDASNLFYELRQGDPSLAKPSPRILVLLYASDLVFRLRWEIEPALAEGHHVVAAPYVETALAFGRAAGLPRKWLAELFSFAPKPADCFRIPAEPNGAPWMGKASSGFIEICCHMLGSEGLRCNAGELRRRVTENLDALERRGGCRASSSL